MLECWRRDPDERPSFTEIQLFLQRKNLGYSPNWKKRSKGEEDCFPIKRERGKEKKKEKNKQKWWLFLKKGGVSSEVSF